MKIITGSQYHDISEDAVLTVQHVEIDLDDDFEVQGVEITLVQGTNFWSEPTIVSIEEFAEYLDEGLWVEVDR